MKAAVLHGKEDFKVEDVDDPRLSPDGVIIRVKAVGVCGTDLPTYHWGPGRGPMRMGHEYSGEVVEVGANVTDIKKGDRIAGRGEPAFAEYLSIPRGLHDGKCYQAVIVPDDMPYEVACMAEPLSCGVNAVRRAEPKTGDTVVVMGAGMIGQGTWQTFRAMGVSRIIVSELGRKRLKVTEALGPDRVVKADESDLAGIVSEMTSGKGADIVADCVGSAKTLQLAMDMARGCGWWYSTQPGPSDADDLASEGGKVMLVGLTGLAGKMDFNLDQAICKGLKMIGSICGDLIPARDLMAQGKIDIMPLISHEFALDEINEAFRMAANPDESVKVVIKP